MNITHLVTNLYRIERMRALNASRLANAQRAALVRDIVTAPRLDLNTALWAHQDLKAKRRNRRG